MISKDGVSFFTRYFCHTYLLYIPAQYADCMYLGIGHSVPHESQHRIANGSRSKLLQAGDIICRQLIVFLRIIF